MATIITIILNDHDVTGYCNATPVTPLIERKCAAIIMAAMDGVTAAMNEGGEQFALKSLIGPTISKRSKEGWLEDV